MKKNSYMNTILSIITAFLLGGVLIVAMGHNPLHAYAELFKGAFHGAYNFGGTLERFVPLLLTGLAFSVASIVSFSNVGVEGELYLGAMAAAWVGFSVTGLSKISHIMLCILVSMIVGGLWALIPGILKAYYNVNEICTTILLNYVAIFITSYLVNYPLSAKTGIAQTPDIADTATLTRIMKPSRANTGLFIGIGILLFIYWFLHYTKSGYRLRNVGLNPDFAEYVGINPRRTLLWGVFLSGAIGGIAGAIQVLGIHGNFLDNFSPGIAFDGMLAALIARNNIKMLPVMAFFLAGLKSGALGLERFTGIEKSLIDIIIVIFILLATMEGLFNLKDRRLKIKGLFKSKDEKLEKAKNRE